MKKDDGLTLVELLAIILLIGSIPFAYKQYKKKERTSSQIRSAEAVFPLTRIHVPSDVSLSTNGRFAVLGRSGVMPTGDMMDSGNTSKLIQVWDIATRTTIFELDYKESFKPKKESIVLSPNGEILAVPQHSGIVELWDMNHPSSSTRINVELLISPGFFYHRFGGLAFSNDSTRIALGYNGDVFVWNLKSARIERQINVGKMIDRLAFSRDGSQLAVSTSTENKIGRNTESNLMVYVWDTSSWKEVNTLLVEGSCTNSCTLEFAPDGKQLVLGQKCGRFLWNLPTGGVPKRESQPSCEAFVISNGKYLTQSALEMTSKEGLIIMNDIQASDRIVSAETTGEWGKAEVKLIHSWSPSPKRDQVIVGFHTVQDSCRKYKGECHGGILEHVGGSVEIWRLP